MNHEAANEIAQVEVNKAGKVTRYSLRTYQYTYDIDGRTTTRTGSQVFRQISESEWKEQSTHDWVLDADTWAKGMKRKGQKVTRIA